MAADSAAVAKCDVKDIRIPVALLLGFLMGFLVRIHGTVMSVMTG